MPIFINPDLRRIARYNEDLAASLSKKPRPFRTMVLATLTEREKSGEDTYHISRFLKSAFSAPKAPTESSYDELVFGFDDALSNALSENERDALTETVSAAVEHGAITLGSVPRVAKSIGATLRNLRSPDERPKDLGAAIGFSLQQGVIGEHHLDAYLSALGSASKKGHSPLKLAKSIHDSIRPPQYSLDGLVIIHPPIDRSVSPSALEHILAVVGMKTKRHEPSELVRHGLGAYLEGVPAHKIPRYQEQFLKRDIFPTSGLLKKYHELPRK